MTIPRLAVPPGRAGRLWLERRLAVAYRAADLLDRKLRLLQTDLAELREQAARTAADWESGSAEAADRLLQAVLLGGQRAIRLAADSEPADVRIYYAVTLGVHHPAGGSCEPREDPIPWERLSTAEAARAHRAALEAAVRHAAAAAALRIMEAEAVATRYRLRAVRDRWIPRLEQARADIAFAIDELERADAARLRLVTGSLGRRLAGRHPGTAG